MSGTDVFFASDQQRDVAVSLPVGATSNILIQSWLRDGEGREEREEEEEEEKMRDGKEKSEKRTESAEGPFYNATEESETNQAYSVHLTYTHTMPSVQWPREHHTLVCDIAAC